MLTAPTVITPHHGEFRRLTGEEPGWEQAAAFAAGTGAVVLLKGAPTFVAGHEGWAVTSGGPGRRWGGSPAWRFSSRQPICWPRPGGATRIPGTRSAAHRHGLAGAALARETTVTATGLMGVIGEWA